MANSGKFAPRDLPPYFLHPMHSEQLTKVAFDALQPSHMEEHGGLCPGHKRTVVYLAGSGENRKFIVEVVLASGPFFIESPCTFTPSMGIDSLDGNLAQDAEEWVLVQQLRVKPKRLKYVFGGKDRLPANEYIKIVSFPHVSEDWEYEFDSQPIQAQPSVPIAPAVNTETMVSEPTKKKWWKFW